MSFSQPLVVEFESGSRVLSDGLGALPVAEDLVVQFADGNRLSLPADQVVTEGHADGRARISFGGMSFEGVKDESLQFWRVFDLLPEEERSFERPHHLALSSMRVASVHVDGRRVWPIEA